MRYFLFFIVLTIISCSGQQTINQQTPIDTAKLFNPNGYPDHDYSNESSMFKRAVGVVQQGYALKLNDEETDVETLKEVDSFIVSNKEIIEKNLFYILMDSTTNFERTLSVINILTQHQITNYKVINIQKYFTPPEPITVRGPTTITTKTIDANDSTYFSITISKDSFEINFLNKKQFLKSSAKVDKFIQDNKTLINPNKILLRGNTDYHSDKFKSLIELFKKYNYFKYHLMTN